LSKLITIFYVIAKWLSYVLIAVLVVYFLFLVLENTIFISDEKQWCKKERPELTFEECSEEFGY